MQVPLIVQYWHAKVPPAEVAELMQTWEAAAAEGFAYQLFDDESALAFIRTHYDRRTVAAYLSCAVPAMRADFFRICALLRHPGIYVDADMRRTGAGQRAFFLQDELVPLMPLYTRLQRGLLFKRETRIANGFMVVKESDDELLRTILRSATENIEGRVSNNVYLVTGPGIATKLFNRLGHEHPLFSGFEFWTADELAPYVRMVGKLPYKASVDHWLNAQQLGSIFTAPAADPHDPADPSLEGS